MFASVGEAAGDKALGILLTGMGSDGAQGLLRMKRAGAKTIVQDEGSCVVYGMPREAVKLGAADQVLPLDAISGRHCCGQRDNCLDEGAVIAYRLIQTYPAALADPILPEHDRGAA